MTQLILPLTCGNCRFKGYSKSRASGDHLTLMPLFATMAPRGIADWPFSWQGLGLCPALRGNFYDQSSAESRPQIPALSLPVWVWNQNFCCSTAQQGSIPRHSRGSAEVETMQLSTALSLLLEEQSDQGLHCLLFQLHLFDEICLSLAYLFEF